jgi:hypothetical protein
VIIKVNDIVKELAAHPEIKGKIAVPLLRVIVGALSEMIAMREEVEHCLHKNGVRRHAESVRKGTIFKQMNNRKRK